MKTLVIAVLVSLVFLLPPGLCPAQEAPAYSADKPAGAEGLIKPMVSLPFYVFNNKISPPVKNFAPSGYMGDISDLRLTGSYKVVLNDGYPSLRITYLAKGPIGWSGVVWQNPPNNWGDLSGGYNLSSATRLTFYAKGEKGGEVVEFKLGGTLGNYPDSANISSGDITLTSEWTQYVIELTEADLGNISAGFGLVLKQESSPEGCTFFLDDIKYE